MLADPGNGTQKANAQEHAAPRDPGSSMQEVNTSKPTGADAMRNDSEGTEPGEPGGGLREEIASAIDLSQMSGWPGQEGDEDVDDWEKVRGLSAGRRGGHAACNIHSVYSLWHVGWYSDVNICTSCLSALYQDLTCSGGLWRV